MLTNVREASLGSSASTTAAMSLSPGSPQLPRGSRGSTNSPAQALHSTRPNPGHPTVAGISRDQTPPLLPMSPQGEGPSARKSLWASVFCNFFQKQPCHSPTVGLKHDDRRIWLFSCYCPKQSLSPKHLQPSLSLSFLIISSIQTPEILPQQFFSSRFPFQWLRVGPPTVPPHVVSQL